MCQANNLTLRAPKLVFIVTVYELPLMFQFVSSNLYLFYTGISYIMTQQSMTMPFMKENKKIKKKKVRPNGRRKRKKQRSGLRYPKTCIITLLQI